MSKVENKRPPIIAIQPFFIAPPHKLSREVNDQCVDAFTAIFLFEGDPNASL
jgi:hypothetical protein